jgi:hypothetical protein
MYVMYVLYATPFESGGYATLSSLEQDDPPRDDGFSYVAFGSSGTSLANCLVYSELPFGRGFGVFRILLMI